jgi:hypothetical protein
MIELNATLVELTADVWMMGTMHRDAQRVTPTSKFT